MKRIGFAGLGIVGKPEVVFRASSGEIDENLNASTMPP